MSLEDEQLKNFRKRSKNDNSYIFFSSNPKVIGTKISSKSIIDRDDIGFKVKRCDDNQLKMILLDEGISPEYCSNPASVVLDNFSEKRILTQIKNTESIYNKLLNSEGYILMRLLFDNDIVFYTEFYYRFKSYLLSKICENINYKLIESQIDNISLVHYHIDRSKQYLINSINENSLIDKKFKRCLILCINNMNNTDEFSKFLVSLSKDSKKEQKTVNDNWDDSKYEYGVSSQNMISNKLNSKSEIINPVSKIKRNSNNLNNKKPIINHNNIKTSDFNNSRKHQPKKTYVRKFRIIDNPNMNKIEFFKDFSSTDSFANSIDDTKVEPYKFEFSRADKKVNKALYLYQQEILNEDLKNDAINQMNKILHYISNRNLTEENKEKIKEDIDEIKAFIEKHNLTFKRIINDKQKELDKSFKSFCDAIEENKIKNLKQNVYSIYNDLFKNNMNLNAIENKYPNFYFYLAENDVFNYTKKLIRLDSEFSDKFKKIVNYFIKNYESNTRKTYNSVIKKLKKPDYIDKKNLINIKRKYDLSIKYFTNLNKLKSYYNTSKKINFKTFDVESMVNQHNTKFIENEYHKNKTFFDNFNGYKLDENQREVVLSDENVSKIIAGAGSGKTFTLLAKIKYLLDYQNVSQDKILCISFSNAAVGDLKDKIKDTIGENSIDVVTFHKLGGGILKDNNQDYIPNKHLLRETIDKYFEEYIISNPKKVKKIIDFFNIHNYNSKNNEDDLHLVKNGNLADLRNSKQFSTLKDKINQLTDYEFNIKNNNSAEDVKTVNRYYVRSFEELIIANFLFVNNIDYIYEDDFFKRKNITPEEGYTQYRPDFYLPKHDVYIEHYGVDRNLNAKQLNDSDRKVYKDSIYWKRGIHKEYNSKLIETFSYENWEGNLLKNLRRKLEEKGVIFSEVNYSRIYDRLIKNKKLDDLEKVMDIIENFIGLFKTNGFHIDDYGNDVSDIKFSEIKREIESNNDFLKTRNKFLFEIITDIYDLYQTQNGIDFNDMINNPIKLLNSNCKLKDYDYIFVDEYQDTSYSRYRLLKEIVDRTNAKIISVGDDWQSIYSFSGCQIELFTNFSNYFDYSKEFKIQKNYRNSSDLINVASNFILDNNLQKQKRLIADKKYPKKSVKLGKYKYSRDLSLIFEDMIKEISYNSPNGEILILGRYKDDFKSILAPCLFEIDDFYNYEKTLREKGYLTIKYIEDLSVKIRFRTMHKSKGLEADNVIIIGLKYKDKKGFPSKIDDDSIIQYVLNKNKEDTRYAEERRLFYVALTRTRNNVYLLSHETEPSEFIDDLEKLDKDNKIEFREYRFNNEDYKRMDLFMHKKFREKTRIDTKLKCSKCGKGAIVLFKKGTGKGYFRCSVCDFDFGAFNQSPDLIDTLDYCDVDGCNGLTYIKEVDGMERKICSYYGKTKCDGGRKSE